MPQPPSTESNPPPDAAAKGSPSIPAAPAATNRTQLVLVALGMIAFLYFAKAVVLPVFLACVGAMTLKPPIRWLSRYRVSPSFSSAILLCVLGGIIGVAFFQLGRPAMSWMSEAPEHLTELRQRVQTLLPRLSRFSKTAAAVNNLGATEAEKKEEQKLMPTVEIKERSGAGLILNWTGTLLVGIGETLVLLYLILASGDLFLLKLVHVMPTLSDKKRAVEISHEIQQNISNYLFSVSVINVILGLVASGGLYWLGVPNALMWGMWVAVLNFVPYFGPVAGVLLLGVVGFLTFDTLLLGLLPAGWFLLLHLLESYLVTPVVLGRRFTLNPVVIFVSLIFWTWLWGVPGALLAVPILVSVKVVCDRVPSLSKVSELLSSLA